jgi:26S proteasome regulatory subunit N5
MNDGQLETKLDLTAETEQKLAQAKTLAASPSGLGPAIDLLLSAEKATRVGNDLESLKLVVTACVDLCKAANDYEKLLETINFIAKRRSQKNGAIQAVVKGGMDCLEGSPDEATKEKLVRCLRDITDGKIYVEGERASLTMTLALMLEKQDKINEAATVVQEVHVETYGSLSKKEKVEFILEQVRLVLRKKDFVRVSRKRSEAKSESKQSVKLDEANGAHVQYMLTLAIRAYAYKL